MGIARLVATGSTARGAFSMRIEGVGPHEWCDAVQLIGTGSTNDFERIGGLNSEGIRIGEEPDIIAGTLKPDGMTVRVMGPEALSAFSRRASVRTYLTTDLDASFASTNMEVMSTAGFVVGKYYHLNTECVKVAAIVDTTNLTVVRAQFDTVLQAHYADLSLTGFRRTLVTDVPTVMARRRARIFWYADAEVDTGTATQFFIGVLDGAPKRDRDGLSWVVKIKPLTDLLESDLGRDISEEIGVRGAMYNNANRLVVIVEELTGDGVTDLPAINRVTVQIGVSSDGTPEHFESNEEVCATINDRLDTGTTSWAGWNGHVAALPRSDGTWGFDVTFDTGPNWIRITATSVLDGTTDTLRMWDPETGSYVYAAVLGSTYMVPWLASSAPSGARKIPRGSFGVVPGEGTGPGFGLNIRWLALAGGVAVADVDHLRIEWPSGNVTLHEVLEVDAAERLVRIDFGREWGEYAYYEEYIGAEPKIRLIRVIATDASLYDFLAAIVAASPANANLGSVPWLTDVDIDLAEIALTVATCAADTAWATHRFYAQSGPVRLSKWIAEEAKILGAILCLAADGRITMRPMRQRAPTDAAVATLTAPDPTQAAPNGTIFDDAGVPEWEPYANGMVNVIELRTQYEPATREWVGRQFSFLLQPSIGESKSTRVLEIAPYSSSDGRTDAVIFEQAAQLAERVFGFFGADYQVIGAEVPLSAIGIRIGDSVKVTHPAIPNPDSGENGVTDLQCMVIGRHFEPGKAGGRLVLYTTGLKIAGYAPALRLLTITSVGGSTTVWDVVVLTSFMVGGGIVSDHFKAGERIQVSRFDNVTPGTIAGVITSFTPPKTLRITVDSAWVPGADKWDIETADADDAALASRQELYGFEAQADGLISFDSGDVPAQVFAVGAESTGTLLGGFIRGGHAIAGPDLTSPGAINTTRAFYILQNAAHLAIANAQVIANISTDEYLVPDKGWLADTYYPVFKGDYRATMRSDGTPDAIRCRIGGARSGGAGTVTFALVAFGIDRDPETEIDAAGDNVLIVTSSSSTHAWLDDDVLEVPIAQALASVERIAVHDAPAAGDDPTVTQWCRIRFEVWVKSTSTGSTPQLSGLYAAEFGGPL